MSGTLLLDFGFDPSTARILGPVFTVVSSAVLALSFFQFVTE